MQSVFIVVMLDCSGLLRATMVARTLFFAPQLTALADEIASGMEAAGVGTFNSLHLRIEKDAKDWSAIMGGNGVSAEAQQSCLLGAHTIVWHVLLLVILRLYGRCSDAESTGLLL